MHFTGYSLGTVLQLIGIRYTGNRAVKETTSSKGIAPRVQDIKLLQYMPPAVVLLLSRVIAALVAMLCFSKWFGENEVERCCMAYMLPTSRAQLPAKKERDTLISHLYSRKSRRWMELPACIKHRNQIIICVNDTQHALCPPWQSCLPVTSLSPELYRDDYLDNRAVLSQVRALLCDECLKCSIVPVVIKRYRARLILKILILYFVEYLEQYFVNL